MLCPPSRLGPEQTMVGLFPDNRRVRPTGRMILHHLGELTLRIGHATDPPTVQITRESSSASWNSSVVHPHRARYAIEISPALEAIPYEA